MKMRSQTSNPGWPARRKGPANILRLVPAGLLKVAFVISSLSETFGRSFFVLMNPGNGSASRRKASSRNKITGQPGLHLHCIFAGKQTKYCHGHW